MSWKIPVEKIQSIIAQCDEQVWEPFPGITIMAWLLPNGYTIVESSGCVDPSEYNRELGMHNCREALTRKLWQLEGYLRKQEYNKKTNMGRADD